MRLHYILIIGLVFLLGCNSPETAEETKAINEEPAENVPETPQPDIQALETNIKVQEYGLRLTLERISIQGDDIHANFLGERLLDEFDIPAPEDMVGYFYYTNGNLHKMKVCDLKIIDEKTWEADYCDNINELNDEIFNGKIYFVLSSELISKLEGKFIRYVDSNDWTCIFPLDFKDTFIKKQGIN